jgi:hypothetical protein
MVAIRKAGLVCDVDIRSNGGRRAAVRRRDDVPTNHHSFVIGLWKQLGWAYISLPCHRQISNHYSVWFRFVSSFSNCPTSLNNSEYGTSMCLDPFGKRRRRDRDAGQFRPVKMSGEKPSCKPCK